MILSQKEQKEGANPFFLLPTHLYTKEPETPSHGPAIRSIDIWRSGHAHKGFDYDGLNNSHIDLTGKVLWSVI